MVSQEHLKLGHLSVGQLAREWRLMVGQEHLKLGHLSVGHLDRKWRSHGKPRAP